MRILLALLLVVAVVAVRVKDEAPLTKSALQTLYFKPFEESPTLLQIEHRNLDLLDGFDDEERFAEELTQLKSAYLFLHKKHTEPHPCAQYRHDVAYHNEHNVCNGRICNAIYFVPPEPSKLCRRFMRNGNIYDSNGEYGVPVPHGETREKEDADLKPKIVWEISEEEQAALDKEMEEEESEEPPAGGWKPEL